MEGKSYEMCGSRETSKTFKTVGPRDQVLGPLPYMTFGKLYSGIFKAFFDTVFLSLFCVEWMTNNYFVEHFRGRSLQLTQGHLTGPLVIAFLAQTCLLCFLVTVFASLKLSNLGETPEAFTKQLDSYVE